ncbi:hypothetical protein [Acutalibacter caecimuris]|uniref:hypothetical protein n=1 Tax=Acutalibacter caecimuris TaxID=3093657 RepID=UPI002AC91701|nr:hypothetical protein [Acutalibacter sp. M00118]
MTYWGILPGGGQFLLGAPAEAVLSYDREAPADQLKAVFPADRAWEDLAEVWVYHGGEGVFRGIVDEQNTRLTASGLWVELVCRSREALLLDSEAEPRAIRNPSLERLRRRLLEPLGFGEATGGQGAMPGELAVEKGTSCWQVLAGFCRDCLGTVPYVDFAGRVRCEGREPRTLALGQVLAAEISRRPYKRLSAVWKQGYRGGYDTLYRDAGAPVARRRYISAQSGKNPRAVLQKAQQESFLLTVTCQGAWWPAWGVADVEIPKAGRFTGCPVCRAVYHQDSGGARTRFVLERGETDVADGTAGSGAAP